jgi:hypothetical protein
MYRALAALRKNVLPKSRKWFCLMAEGPVDEIQRIQSQIDAYTSLDVATGDDSAQADIQAEVSRRPPEPLPIGNGGKGSAAIVDPND